MEKKPWYKSKTIWLNVLTIVAGAGSVVQIWTPFLGPIGTGVALSIVGTANILLRSVTSNGISLKA